MKRSFRKFIAAARFSVIYPACRLVTYLLSYLVPRRADLWVFGGINDLFTDNAKYLYLWVSANCPDIRAIWITGRETVYRELASHGYRAAYRWSVAGVGAAIRAKLHIFSAFVDDVHFPFSGGSLQINLWHGVGIKNIQYAARIGPIGKTLAQKRNPFVRIKRWAYFCEPDVFLSTSPTMSQHFARCFQIPAERCPQLGYPRLDVAANEDLRQRALALGDYSSVHEAFSAYSELYLYMPTYRDTGRDFIADAFPDLNRLAGALAARRAALYIKLHSATRQLPSVERVSEHANIRMWPADLDVYPLLASFDVLVTDYSSVLYDYIFLKDRGVILYTFDYDQYTKIDRDLAFPFEDNVIGLRVNHFDELCGVIERGDALSSLPSDKLKQLRHRFWGDCISPASPRVTACLREMSTSARRR